MYKPAKSFCFLMLLAFITVKVSGQTSGFKIGGIYAQTNRTQQQTYLETLSEVHSFAETLNVTTGYGLALGYVVRTNKGEFEAGGSLSAASDRLTDDLSNSLTFKARDIALYFGGNYVPFKFLILGAGLNINAAENTCTSEGPIANVVILESTPSEDFNIFKGYSVGLKAQAGFNIPFKDDELTGLRIMPFYAFSFGKYNFYNVTNKRLANYAGDPKTNFQNMGIEVDVVFGM